MAINKGKRELGSQELKIPAKQNRKGNEKAFPKKVFWHKQETVCS